MQVNRFKTTFAENIFRQKYAQGPNDTWDNLAARVVECICGPDEQGRQLMHHADQEQLVQYDQSLKKDIYLVDIPEVLHNLS